MLPRLLVLLPLLASCAGGFSDPSRAQGAPVDAAAPTHPEVLHVPTTLGVVDTPRLDANGTPLGVACATCHAPDGGIIGDENGEPEAFHTKVELRHGELSCAHCHDPVDRSRLRLADASTVPMADAMQLCSQCHGPQARDWRHGAHGGMSGYWDLRRGPRERNHCVDCHAPHAPAYARVMPVFPPQDRFLPTEGAH